MEWLFHYRCVCVCVCLKPSYLCVGGWLSWVQNVSTSILKMASMLCLDSTSVLFCLMATKSSRFIFITIYLQDVFNFFRNKSVVPKRGSRLSEMARGESLIAPKTPCLSLLCFIKLLGFPSLASTISGYLSFVLIPLIPIYGDNGAWKSKTRDTTRWVSSKTNWSLFL